MSPAGPGSTSGTDDFVIFIAGCVAVVAVLGSAGVFWGAGVTWLVEHQLLLAPGAHPLLALPAADGAGLDGARLAVLAAGLLGLVAWGGSAIHHKIAAGRSVQ